MAALVHGTFNQIPFWRLRARFRACGYYDGEVADAPRSIEGRNAHAFVVGAPYHEDEVLDDELKSKSEDKLVMAWRGHYVREQAALYQIAYGEHNEHGRHHGDIRQGTGERVYLESDIHAQSEESSVGEVCYLHDAEYQLYAERCESVHAAHQQPVEPRLHECGHCLRLLVAFHQLLVLKSASANSSGQITTCLPSWIWMRTPAAFGSSPVSSNSIGPLNAKS